MSVALEALQRREMRRSLTAWSLACGFVPALHHRFVIRQIELVLEGKIRKLMLLLPPGSAKSTYSSVLLPPHFLCRKPGSRILSCSHSADLASSFGRKARNLVEQKSKELGFALASHSKAADRWETTNGGEYYATGVGAGIAGYRADLGLIDDPIGKKEDAESQLQRDKVWDWYHFDFIPRHKPNASIILIQTRWHEDDLAGRLLSREKQEWTVASLPLYAEDSDVLGRQPGETLWPEYFNAAYCEQAKRNPAFTSLYQCRPAPEDGDYFKREWMLEYNRDELPKKLRIYVGSDHAVGLKQENDRTCILPVGVDENDHIWILPDVWWKRGDAMEQVEAMLDLGERRSPMYWWAEKGHITMSLGPFLQKRMFEKGVFLPIEEIHSAKDKPTRAQSIRGRMSQKCVHFPAYASWWQEAKHELLSFPVGTHDDFVDALSEIGQGMARMRGQRIEVEQTEQGLPDFVPTIKWLKDSDEAKQRAKRIAALGM
jgi:predicted phage terminase large subunit-like protein